MDDSVILGFGEVMCSDYWDVMVMDKGGGEKGWKRLIRCGG